METLQSSEIKFLVDHVSDAIIRFKNDGRIYRVNSAACSLFGRSEQDLEHITITRLMPVFMAEQFDQIIEKAIQEHGIETDIHFLDNNQRLLLTRAHLHYSDDEQAFLCLLSNRKELQAERVRLYRQMEFNKIVGLVSEVVTRDSSRSEVLHAAINQFEAFFMCDHMHIFIFENDSQFSLFDSSEKVFIHQLPEAFKKGHPLITEDLIFELKRRNAICQISERGIEAFNAADFKGYLSIPITEKNETSGLMLAQFRTISDPDLLNDEKLLAFARIISLAIIKSRLNEQLQASDKNYRSLVNNAIDGIYISSSEGKIVFANPSFIEMLEYGNLDELKKIDLRSDLYVDPEDRVRFLKLFDKERVIRNYESRIKTKTGKIITCLENSRAYREPDGTLMIEGVLENISERKSLQEELKYQINLADSIIEEASILINALNENGEFILWNRKCEQATGYSRNEAMNDKELLKKLYPDEDYYNYVIEKSEEQLLAHIDNPIDFELINKKGEKRVIRWTSMFLPVQLDQQKIVLSFGVDITQLRYLESQLLQAQKMESLGTLAGGIAHDFNNILSGLLGYASFLKLQVEKNSKHYNILQKMEVAIEDGASLTSKLLGFARKGKFNLQHVIAAEAIENVISVLERTFQKSIQIQRNFISKDRIEVDATQFQQVIMNIAINARDAMREGGTLSFETRRVNAANERYLLPHLPEKEIFVKITIEDNGSGMSEEVRQRIFEPFFTTKKEDKGTGLGLSMVYGIVKNHGGYIFVESEETLGTRFILYLPLSEGADSEGGHQLELELAKKTKPLKRILVVDDEEIIRDLLYDVLIENNFEVLCASDGREGLDIFYKNRDTIDLIILDIIMPGLSGREVFNEIRAKDSSTKIIITSGYSKQRVTQELISQGADGFLPKPFNIHKLMDLINEITTN